jgi:hypothetical protein
MFWRHMGTSARRQVGRRFKFPSENKTTRELGKTMFGRRQRKLALYLASKTSDAASNNRQVFAIRTVCMFSVCSAEMATSLQVGGRQLDPLW